MHTLLVAEDAASLPAEVHDVLARRGHTVTSATSLAIALALQRTAPADMLVLDWRSAKHSAPRLGEALLRASQGAETALLAVVGPESSDLEEALSAGVSDYLSLPLALPAVEARIAIVERWLELLRARQAPHHEGPVVHSLLDADFRAILDACPEPICMHRNRIIVYANPALGSSLGFDSGAALTGLSLVQFIHPDDRTMVEERLETLERTGLPMPLREERFLARDGSVRVGEAHSFVIQFEDGAALVSLGRDLTERRALEAQSRHSERLASVGTIAASVAHELNNPLMLVLCNLADLSCALPALSPHVPHELVERLETRVHAIEEAAAQMRTLAHDLTDFVRTKEAATERMRLHHVLERSVRMVRPYAKSHGDVRVEHDLEDVGEVSGSETRVLQVFLNLLINAVDAVSTCSTVHERRIVVQLRRQDAEAVALVSDTGPGVPDELRTRIFEPFFSTKARGKGTGLGLAVAKTVIDSMHGRVSVLQSAVGATFEVRLPLVDGA